MQGAGRHLAGSQYPDDDGSPDLRLRAAIAQGNVDMHQFAGARLLVAVVAVADEVDETGDKESHMAIVSMVNAEGQRGLLAFTGLDALHLWQADARPVPVTAAQAAMSALDDGAEAIVIDVQGPVRMVIAGQALRELAGLMSA